MASLAISLVGVASQLVLFSLLFLEGVAGVPRSDLVLAVMWVMGVAVTLHRYTVNRDQVYAGLMLGMHGVILAALLWVWTGSSLGPLGRVAFATLVIVLGCAAIWHRLRKLRPGEGRG